MDDDRRPEEQGPEQGKDLDIETPGLIEEPPDERALPVVDAAAGDETQELLALVLREVFVDVGGDQG